MVEHDLLEITEALYDAAGGDQPWTGFGRQVARLVGGLSTTLMVGDFAAGMAAAGGIQVLCGADMPAEGTADYLRYYHQHDMWTRAATAFALSTPTDAPLRLFANNQTLVDDRAYLRSEFYNDFARHYGLRYAAGTVLRAGDAGLVAFAVQRPASANPFETEERAVLGTLLPHVRNAIRLRHRLSGVESQIGFAALDALPNPVLVLDAEMGVVFANQAAERAAVAPAPAFRLVAARRAGGLAHGLRTLLVPAHGKEARQLAALVQATVAGGPGGAARLSDTEGMPAHAALVAPLPGRYARPSGAGMGRARGRVLLMLRPLPGAAPLRVDLLRDLFGLTQAEAEVARALAGGASKAAVAAGRGLKETTVRTQVRAILEKTGAANLRALEQLLAGLHGV